MRGGKNLEAVFAIDCTSIKSVRNISGSSTHVEHRNSIAKITLPEAATIIVHCAMLNKVARYRLGCIRALALIRYGNVRWTIKDELS